MEVLRRVRIVDQLLKHRNGVWEQDIDKNNEAATVCLFVLPDQLLAFVSRRVLGIEEGGPRPLARRSYVRARRVGKATGLPSRALAVLSRISIARSIRFSHVLSFVSA